jgi:hypothetical protein
LLSALSDGHTLTVNSAEGKTMVGDYLGASATIAVGVLAGVQWYFSWRAQLRQRDSELTTWGSEVITMMAELETACHPLVTSDSFNAQEIEKLSYRASALVDRGRLFFPNFKKRSRNSIKDDGLRIKLLDEVLRACYVARYLTVNGRSEGRRLRALVWQARGSFVRLLQKEMSPSLRRVRKEDSGDSIPRNPTLWPAPQRDLWLSEHRQSR